jgi:hypothetical protein
MSPGGKMKTHPFIGKTVSLEKLRMAEAEISPRGEYDEFTIAEVFLSDFECNGTDSEGRNAYSIQLYLDEQDRIAKIQRMGHCHMCGGQGSDDELKRFPHRTLEEEADQALIDLLIDIL